MNDTTHAPKRNMYQNMSLLFVQLFINLRDIEKNKIR